MILTITFAVCFVVMSVLYLCAERAIDEALRLADEWKELCSETERIRDLWKVAAEQWEAVADKWRDKRRAHPFEGKGPERECLLCIECKTSKGLSVEWWHAEWKEYDYSEDADHRSEQREGYYIVGNGDFAADYGTITHWAPLPEVEL